MPHRWIWFALTLLAASAATAQEASAPPTEAVPAPVPAPPPSTEPVAPAGAGPARPWQLGMAAILRPTYAGSDRMGWSLKPVLSWQWGRFRIASSSAGLTDSSGEGRSSAGASMALAESDRWSAGAALRIDNGRPSSDDPRLAALPEVRRTVRLRLYGGYVLDRDARQTLSLGSSASTDLLGRGGGSTLSLDLSRRVQLAPDLRWTQGVGIGWADGVYMRSRHGVPVEAAAQAGLPAFSPGAGLTGVSAGTGLAWRFHPHWRLGGSAGIGRQLGPSLDSPLTQQSWGYSVTVGLVYVSGAD